MVIIFAKSRFIRGQFTFYTWRDFVQKGCALNIYMIFWWFYILGSFSIIFADKNLIYFTRNFAPFFIIEFLKLTLHKLHKLEIDPSPKKYEGIYFGCRLLTNFYNKKIRYHWYLILGCSVDDYLFQTENNTFNNKILSKMRHIIISYFYLILFLSIFY